MRWFNFFCSMHSSCTQNVRIIMRRTGFRVLTGYDEPYETGTAPASRVHMLAGLFSCFYSEFNQFPSVSGLFIEPTEFETVVGEFFIRRMFPFGFIAAEHIPYIFRGSVKVVVFGVDDPCQPAIRRVGAQPDSLAGVRVSDEQRMLVALVDDNGLDGDIDVGVDVKCGEHFLFLSGFRLLMV